MQRHFLPPVDPSPEEVSLLREHFSEIASMSADDFALRNSTVYMQKAVTVETPITRHPPHRSRRADFPHRALQKYSLPYFRH